MKKSSIILTAINRIMILTILFCSLINLSIVNITLCYAKENKVLIASWYSRASLIKEGTWKDGKEMRMANGKIFNELDYSCATRMFPLGSILRIVNVDNGRVVYVRVTDRVGMRFARTRIDLSQGAFSKIADLKQGIVPIKVRRVRRWKNPSSTMITRLKAWSNRRTTR